MSSVFVIDAVVSRGLRSITMARPHEVRIVAGCWRGRRLRFPADTDIRPTPDRVRETLFNWLAPHVRGARVLDAFAGSGALGLEALSRGAASVCFVDADLRCVKSLRDHLAEWTTGLPSEIGTAEVRRADVLSWLATPRPLDVPPFDIVFVDPPFAAELWRSTCERLEHGNWLAPEAFIYLEHPAREPLGALPWAGGPWRTGKAGEVGYDLWRRGSSRPAPQEAAP